MTGQTGISEVSKHAEDAVNVVDDTHLLFLLVRVLMSIVWLGVVWSIVRWIKGQADRYKLEGKVSARGFEFEGRAAGVILVILVGYGILMVLSTPFFLFAAFR